MDELRKNRILNTTARSRELWLEIIRSAPVVLLLDKERSTGQYMYGTSSIPRSVRRFRYRVAPILRSLGLSPKWLTWLARGKESDAWQCQLRATRRGARANDWQQGAGEDGSEVAKRRKIEDRWKEPTVRSAPVLPLVATPPPLVRRATEWPPLTRWAAAWASRSAASPLVDC